MRISLREGEPAFETETIHVNYVQLFLGVFDCSVFIRLHDAGFRKNLVGYCRGCAVHCIDYFYGIGRNKPKEKFV